MDINKDSMVSLASHEEVQTHRILLPHQYYGVIADPRRNDGARAVMLAVLEDAIRLHHQQRGKHRASASIFRRG